MFAGLTPDRHLSQLSTYWRRVRARAGVEDVRIHDLRHSFASRALALGESLTMIGRLLGHTDVGSTARYAHLARDAEKTAVARWAAASRPTFCASGPPLRTVGIGLRRLNGVGDQKTGGRQWRSCNEGRCRTALSTGCLSRARTSSTGIRDLSGFGVRVYRSEPVYLVQGRGPGGSKRIAVGRHGVISADEARRRGRCC